jgi:predicted DCC family thiol-disulfide oxidoreductase YuxK
VTEDAPQGGSASEPVAHPILLYDGVCGLCNRLVQFVLRRDPVGVFRFASLQSGFAGIILARHGADARDLDTVYVVVNCALEDEHLLSRSDAVSYIFQHLGAAELRSARPGLRPGPTQATPRPGSLFWRLSGILLQVVPRALREWGYRMVARNRYRIFGRYDTCPMPTEETRSRFLA